MSMTSRDEISWEADLPLLSRQMLRQWTLAMLATAAVMMALLGTLFAAQQEWDTLVPMATMVGAVTGGLWLLGIAVMVVVFRGKYRVRYTVSDRGVRCDTIDRTARAASRIAVVAGVLGRRPQVAGAGLLSLSRESEEANWSGAFRMALDEPRHSITLRGSWRTLLWVQCTPENFAAVKSAIAGHMAAHQTAGRVSRSSPVPRYLGRSLIVVASSVPLLAAAGEFDTGLLVPIVTLCFALATVWLINVFGWVVLGGLVVQAAQLLLVELEVRRSIFGRGETYRAYEVLGGDDLTLLMLAGIGAAALALLSVRALKGRWLAALLEGGVEMGA
jgi:uncharacterized membrane protein YecN with MAPEG domain